jgi:tagatose-6-phosphate ketose/aldose isomerase
VIDKSTLIVFLFSSNEYVQKYEFDLVESINRGENGLLRVGIMEKPFDTIDLDMKLVYGCNGESLPGPLHSMCCVMPAQILGFFKSLSLGLKPDTPSESGTITRVVQGVDIYKYMKKGSGNLAPSKEFA